ncbi:MAG TPA: ABC transporter substrate-binding protein [Rhizomicrobium sp.]
MTENYIRQMSLATPDPAGPVCAAKSMKRTVLLTFLCIAQVFLCAQVGAAPTRIVSTFLCTDEYVFRLAARPRIAALSFLAGDTHPIVSTIAGQLGGIRLIRPDTETVLGLSPDLVVMYQGTNPKLLQHLKELGIPVVEVPWANSLADVRRVTLMLGRVLGAEGKAEAMLAQMDRTLAAAKAGAARPPVRTLIYQANGYAGTGEFTGEIMSAAGLSDASPSYRTMRTGAIPVEAVIAAQPDLLILNGQEKAETSHADLVLHHPALAALKGRTMVAWTSLTPLLCPGPWSADAAIPFATLGREARANSGPKS